MEHMMSDLTSYGSMLLLAVIQGLTEFLPVSSSGHLALGEMILGIGEGSLVATLILHAGTLVAVIFFYRKVIAELLRGFFSGQGPGLDGLSARAYVGLVVLGNVPAILVGFTLKDQIEGLFTSPWAVFAAMAATACVLWTTRGRLAGSAGPSVRSVIIIGCAQAIAILPGASRSGWTIAIALWLGLKPEAAARFSFLLSIPVICGALVLELKDGITGSTPAGALALGFVVAAATGIFALRWLVLLVRKMELYRFSIYLWALTAVGAGFLLLR